MTFATMISYSDHASTTAPERDTGQTTSPVSSSTRPAASAPGRRTLTGSLASPVQRKVRIDGGEGGDLPQAATAPASGGSPLPGDVRERMEGSFQTSFSDVRVFHGDQADAMGARAFTRGSEVHFAPGEYDPASSRGRSLIGHELAHVVQQRSGRVHGEQGFGGLINADHALEQEADAAGDRAARGEPAGLVGSAMFTPNGMIQRAIRIGKNKTKPPYDNWKDFAKDIPKPFQEGLAKHQETIEKMLADTSPEPHTFGSFKELLDRLEGTGNEDLEDDDSSRCIKLGLEEGAQALAKKKILLFDRTDAPEVVQPALEKGAFLVVCTDHGIKPSVFGKVFGKLCSQIVLVDGESMLFVTLWLAHRHGLTVCLDGGSVGKWLDDEEYVIPQSPQMRGDMHDVLPALALDPCMKVALCVTMPSGYGDADIILGYYSGYKNRVVVCPFGGGTLTSLGAKCKRIGEATEVLVQAVQRDPIRARKTITEETTGHPGVEDNLLYEEVCEKLGFVSGIPYLIINYRDSGHKPGKNREPSHPELDTGSVGFQQMMEIALELGFVPVPMGQPPLEGAWSGPHLIEYWMFPCCKATETRNKRQAEYGLLRYLAEHFDVRALAMRSGGTDAMVYSGIETISLDLASSGKTKEELALAELGSKFQEGGNRSWMRAAVRDLIMPGKFHQGFFEQPRPETESGTSSKKTDWQGAFSEDDVYHIGQTIHFFFGTGSNPLHGLLELAPNSPLARPEEFALLLSQRRSKEDAQKFLVYVQEMNDARQKLYTSLMRDLPIEILRLELEVIRLELEIIRLRVEKLRLLLRIQELEILQMLRGLDVNLEL